MAFTGKKGFSILEIVAAIFIIGIATTVLTSSIMSSYNSVIKAESYVLASEVSETYTVFASNEITKSTFDSVEENVPIYICDKGDDEAKANCVTLLGTTSYTYKALYENESALSLNGHVYNASRVKMEIEVLKKNFGIYKLSTTIYYSDREVTYAHTFYCSK